MNNREGLRSKRKNKIIESENCENELVYKFRKLSKIMFFMLFFSMKITHLHDTVDCSVAKNSKKYVNI